jgi:hypothetical protein
MLPRPYRDQRVVDERKKKVAEVFATRKAEAEAAAIKAKDESEKEPKNNEGI